MGWKHSESVQIYRSIDAGYFPDPTYCLWIAHAGDRFIAFKERLWYKKVASEVAKDIIEDSQGMRVVATYCDPTMDIKTTADVRSIKDIYEDLGVPLETSINNREHYAHAIHSALSEEVEPGVPRLQIYDKGCPYLIKTIPQQRYDPKHPLRMADHKDDHACVTLAYFLISSGAMEHKTKSTASLPKWMQPKKSDDKYRYLGWENVRA
jgi:(2Fe-2S) ferredoxin